MPRPLLSSMRLSRGGPWRAGRLWQPVLDRRLELCQANERQPNSQQFNTLSGEVDENAAEEEEADDDLVRSPPLEMRSSGAVEELFRLCRLGADEEVREQLTKDTDVAIRKNTSENGQTLLHAAAACGHLIIVNDLLWLTGADVDSTDDLGQTPLHVAAAFGHLGVVQALLDAGADKRALTKAKKYPRDLALLPVIRAALALESYSTNAAVTRASRSSGPLNATRSSGTRAAIRPRSQSHQKRELGEACEKRDLIRIRILLSADPALANSRSSTGASNPTPLHLAAELGFVDVAELLLAAGAQPSSRNAYSWTPLHVAAMNGHVGVVQLLLTAGVCPDEHDLDFRTSLHWAALHNHTAVLRLLLGAGANRTARTLSGATPFTYSDAHESCRLLAPSVRLL